MMSHRGADGRPPVQLPHWQPQTPSPFKRGTPAHTQLQPQLQPLPDPLSHTQLQPQLQPLPDPLSHTQLQPRPDPLGHTQLQPPLQSQPQPELQPQLDPLSHAQLQPQLQPHRDPLGHTQLQPQLQPWPDPLGHTQLQQLPQPRPDPFVSSCGHDKSLPLLLPTGSHPPWPSLPGLAATPCSRGFDVPTPLAVAGGAQQAATGCVPHDAMPHGPLCWWVGGCNTEPGIMGGSRAPGLLDPDPGAPELRRLSAGGGGPGWAPPEASRGGSQRRHHRRTPSPLLGGSQQRREPPSPPPLGAALIRGLATVSHACVRPV